MVSLVQPANPLAGQAHYQRHQPERTLFYQLVKQHYPTFCAVMAKTERPLPDFVQQEFEAYLKCGGLEHGFLRVQCQSCKHEDLVAFSCKMTWAQRLKRVFNIEIEICRHCRGPVKVIACIEDPSVIEKILACLKSKASPPLHQAELPLLPMARAPPEPSAGLWDNSD